MSRKYCEQFVNYVEQLTGFIYGHFSSHLQSTAAVPGCLFSRAAVFSCFSHTCTSMFLVFLCVFSFLSRQWLPAIWWLNRSLWLLSTELRIRFKPQVTTFTQKSDGYNGHSSVQPQTYNFSALSFSTQLISYCLSFRHKTSHLTFRISSRHREFGAVYHQLV